MKLITPENVGKLRLAWKFETSSTSPTGTEPPSDRERLAGISQIVPLVVNGVMYYASPYNYAVALEPESGKEIWRWSWEEYGPLGRRALAYWKGDSVTPPAVFVGTEGGYLIGLDARTGKPLPNFAERGVLNLRKGMSEQHPNRPYGLSSPPAIYKNLLIVGSHLQERPADGPYGDVRAFDVHTGKLVWTFHTIPRPGEFGHDTWLKDGWKNRSGANVWSVMTVDEERGIVYLPIGCATADYDGTDHPGMNLFSTSLVALKAETGERLWHFQTVHHDLWDYDLASPAALIDITYEGKRIPALALMTKQALLFVLDRTTGEPVYGVEERPVPVAGFREGEQPWPTQPFPLKPPPLARTSFKREHIARITAEHTAYCEKLLDGVTLPDGLYPAFAPGQKTLMFPSNVGGSNWPGVAFDPELGYIFASTQDFADIIGGGRFWEAKKFWPCQQPPWGRLTAIDTRTGNIAWQVPLGHYAELEALGVTGAGTPNTSGPTVTAGGVLFISGTLDNKFYAFNSKTGEELWSTHIGDAAGHAIPVTYLGQDGKQYVALSFSGGGYMRDPIIPAVLQVYALP